MRPTIVTHIYCRFSRYEHICSNTLLAMVSLLSMSFYHNITWHLMDFSAGSIPEVTEHGQHGLQGWVEVEAQGHNQCQTTAFVSSLGIWEG